MDTASLYGSLEMKLKRLVDEDDTVALMSILWFMDNQLKGVAQPERGQAKRQIIKLEPDGAQTAWGRDDKSNLRLLVTLIAGLPSSLKMQLAESDLCDLLCNMRVPLVEAQMMAKNLRKHHKDWVPAFIAYTAMAQHLNGRVKEIVQSKALSDKRIVKVKKTIKGCIKNVCSLLDAHTHLMEGEEELRPLGEGEEELVHDWVVQAFTPAADAAVKLKCMTDPCTSSKGKKKVKMNSEAPMNPKMKRVDAFFELYFGDEGKSLAKQYICGALRGAIDDFVLPEVEWCKEKKAVKEEKSSVFRVLMKAEATAAAAFVKGLSRDKRWPWSKKDSLTLEVVQRFMTVVQGGSADKVSLQLIPRKLLVGASEADDEDDGDSIVEKGDVGLSGEDDEEEDEEARILSQSQAVDGLSERTGSGVAALEGQQDLSAPPIGHGPAAFRDGYDQARDCEGEAQPGMEDAGVDTYFASDAPFHPSHTMPSGEESDSDTEAGDFLRQAINIKVRKNLNRPPRDSSSPLLASVDAAAVTCSSHQVVPATHEHKRGEPTGLQQDRDKLSANAAERQTQQQHHQRRPQQQPQQSQPQQPQPQQHRPQQDSHPQPQQQLQHQLKGGPLHGQASIQEGVDISVAQAPPESCQQHSDTSLQQADNKQQQNLAQSHLQAGCLLQRIGNSECSSLQLDGPLLGGNSGQTSTQEGADMPVSQAAPMLQEQQLETNLALSDKQQQPDLLQPDLLADRVLEQIVGTAITHPAMRQPQQTPHDTHLQETQKSGVRLSTTVVGDIGKRKKRKDIPEADAAGRGRVAGKRKCHDQQQDDSNRVAVEPSVRVSARRMEKETMLMYFPTKPNKVKKFCLSSITRKEIRVAYSASLHLLLMRILQLLYAAQHVTLDDLGDSSFFKGVLRSAYPATPTDVEANDLQERLGARLADKDQVGHFVDRLSGDLGCGVFIALYRDEDVSQKRVNLWEIVQPESFADEKLNFMFCIRKQTAELWHLDHPNTRVGGVRDST